MPKIKGTKGRIRIDEEERRENKMNMMSSIVESISSLLKEERNFYLFAFFVVSFVAFYVWAGVVQTRK